MSSKVAQFRGIAEIADALTYGETTSEAVTQQFLAQADKLDKRLGCYVTRLDASALAAARHADAERGAGRVKGPLHGIPLAIKDIIAVEGAPTTSNSLVQDPEWAPRQGDATVVERLRKAGAVIIGKVSTMEFAAGQNDPEKPFAVPRNPWGTEFSPGGSSNGTGVGIAAGLFPGGLGTDTGGSIRLPSAFCGVSGIKATYGRVPTKGVVPLGYTLDHVGPMASSAFDCGLILNAIAGYDPADPTSANVPTVNYAPAAMDLSLKGMKFAIDRKNTVDREGTDPAIRSAFDAALKTLSDAGAVIEDVALPMYNEVSGVVFPLALAEAFIWHKGNFAKRWSDYGRSMRRLMVGGAFVTGADYLQAQRVRRTALGAMTEFLKNYDAILSPTMLCAPPPIDVDLMAVMGLAGTPPWSVLGFPALAIPMGFGGNNLPNSLQIIAAPWREATTLKVGRVYQSMTDWHARVPPIAT